MLMLLVQCCAIIEIDGTMSKFICGILGDNSFVYELQNLIMVIRYLDGLFFPQ